MGKTFLPPSSIRLMNNYDLLAGEYYDPIRHPVCALFRQASYQLLQQALPANIESSVEVGAGDSILAQLLHARGSSLQHTAITDLSAGMLASSLHWEDLGAKCQICAAESLPLADSSVEFLAASLGDSYNRPAFWNETSRVLKSGG